ncbi:E3 ubiquitin-protein ligase Iruka isoform X3 [Megalopta genalis]|uniref:E3 ubiquitin-protein ligase Iruka isoform X3 n=1 Tax=Megalopta genalis TaxID=115081 RepID=UPI0014431192|nr:E3 ubiquitin-protein ligase Iruka isoform X3 [Megalopta genalis]
MAEAVVDGTPTSRFFCHKCSIEIEDLLPDYSCPRCASGFIEELQSGNDNNCPTSGMDLVNDDHDYPLLNNLIERDILDLLGMPDRSQTSSTSNRNSVPVNSTNYLTIRDNRHSYRLVYANPQDYIWGQAGFDAIVTHMLNQLDGTAGPPPLPRKQIDQIPTTTVTQSQVDSKMQCSVCWEDFKLSEPVRQLPCQHLYHAPCILPWLELHGTCPICRQNLGDQNTAEANQDVVRPSLSARFRYTRALLQIMATNESRNNARTSATSSSALNNSNSSDSNSSSTRSSSD